MHKFIARIAALGLLGAVLTGCQTMGTPLSDAAKGSLAASGFSPIDLPAGVPVPANVAVDGIYVCPKERCGSLVMVMMATLSPNAAAQQLNVTLEELIARGALKADTVRAIFQIGVERSPTSIKPNVTSVVMHRNPAGFTARGNGPLSSGKQAYYTATFRVIGNGGRGIMAFSDSPGIANRYARPAWIN